MYTHKQAIRLYRAYGVRVPVALSQRALVAARKRSVAGLAELSVQSNPYHRRGRFETLDAFTARTLAERSAVRAANS